MLLDKFEKTKAAIGTFSLRLKDGTNEMMKGLYLHIIAILLFLSSVSFGQSIDVEKERFPGTEKLIIKSFNGCCAQKGYEAIYYFDDSGRAIKSSNYFKRKLLASYEYRYNEKRLLSEEIMVYHVNKKTSKYTTKFVYAFDHKDRVITKTTHFSNWSTTEFYSDFDALNKPTTVSQTFNNDTIIEKRHYNSLGQEILNQRLKDDTITSTEESKYNEYGDKIYSNIPTLLDKETGKMVFLLGGTRHSIVENYDYTYNSLNQWTAKYVLIDNQKILLEKRIYR